MVVSKSVLMAGGKGLSTLSQESKTKIETIANKKNIFFIIYELKTMGER